MSFGDLAVQRGRGVQGSSTNNNVNKDPYSLLGDSLQLFQRSCIMVKDRITEMRRRKVGPAEKNDLDNQIKEIRELEGRLKNQLDFQFQQLDTIPRAEAATKRTTLSKLQKDYDRLKVNLQAISSESTLVKVSRDLIAENEVFSRIGSFTTAQNSSGNKPLTNSQSDKTNNHSSNDIPGFGSNSHVPLPPPENHHERSQSLTLKPLMQGREVDDAILEERNKEILKMNQDLALVNEMFRDMAVLVEKQGEQIKEIGTATEASHERSKAGLEQINQAAAYQPSCTIC